MSTSILKGGYQTEGKPPRGGWDNTYPLSVIKKKLKKNLKKNLKIFGFNFKMIYICPSYIGIDQIGLNFCTRPTLTNEVGESSKRSVVGPGKCKKKEMHRRVVTFLLLSNLVVSLMGDEKRLGRKVLEKVFSRI